MSKYTKLRSTDGINTNDIIYMSTSQGQVPCIVLEVNPKDNTVKAVFKELMDGLNRPGAFAHPEVAREMILNSGLARFMPVSEYYKKQAPKPPASKPKPEPAPEQGPRTPDMYDFNF